MKKYIVDSTSSQSRETFDTMEEALECVSRWFHIPSADLGTWDNGETDGVTETYVWASQEEADEADDNNDVLAVITEKEA